MTMIIISGGIDLAVGFDDRADGRRDALSINAGMSPSLALAMGIAVGGLVGVINGFVITRLKVVPL
jgi:ribose transport system permease protein